MADFLGMMKQAAQLQSKMQEMQESLANVEVEGISGGGLVAVRMTAKMDVKGVKIDPSLMKAEEREVLEDLLVTALGDARRKAETAMQEKMQSLTGGLGRRPGRRSFDGLSGGLVSGGLLGVGHFRVGHLGAGHLGGAFRRPPPQPPQRRRVAVHRTDQRLQRLLGDHPLAVQPALPGGSAVVGAAGQLGQREAGGVLDRPEFLRQQPCGL